MTDMAMRRRHQMYGIQVSAQRYEDPALKCGDGSIINHKSKTSGANCEFAVNK